MSASPSHRFDAILVGGGLQSALLALSVLGRHPEARLAIVERDGALGGNHTWSFHDGDLDAGMADVVRPLVVRRWPAWEVRFPGLSRRFESGYASLDSERLAAVVEERFERAPNAILFKGREVVALDAGSVRFGDGGRLEAGWVLDARGPVVAPGQRAFQKFVGLEVRLDEPLPVERLPCLMDACVAQLDGFRFVYTLPLAPDRLLIEDTYYSDDPSLDEQAVSRRILEYARARGERVLEVVRSERGVLPLPLETSPFAVSSSPIVGGYRGGWFHPTTGYSMAPAARLAEALCRAWPELPTVERLATLREAQRAQAAFCVLLNRLLFKACAPGKRWRLLERFHRLPSATVARFYALRTTRSDRARILLGRPPRGVSIGRALFELARAGR